ncbi:MAG: hypothetical protein M0O99_08640 [Desulfuromonas thiophila]|jgi:hypothetical protein|nr:hypothetical protein [Desulfuromonas thiophila]
MSTLAQLVAQKEWMEQELARLKNELDVVMTDIGNVVSQRLLDVRTAQQKETGSVNITLEGFKVTETIPKKVSWDQEQLLGMFEKILRAGDKPADYLRLKFDIPEKLWESFAPQVREAFAPARKVEPGKSTLKIEAVA